MTECKNHLIVENKILELPHKYLVFIDETGDSFLHKDEKKYENPTIFPTMTITALIVRNDKYKDVLLYKVDEIKRKYWGDENICFHSNEIRKKDGIFKVLLNEEKYSEFKKEMVEVLDQSEIMIISSSINKLKLLKKAKSFKEMTGENYNVGDLYLINVGYIFERLGHFLKNDDTAKVIFETQGAKESKRIQGVLNDAKKEGTFYCKKENFVGIDKDILFFTKKDNVNGLQMVDYCVYPFARHSKDDDSDNNKLFDILRKYVYQGDFNEYGLKEWP